MQRLMLITCTASEVFAMCGWPTRRPTGNPANAQRPNTDHYTDFSCESKTKKMHRLHVSVFTSFFQPPPPPPPHPPKCCPPSLHTQCIFLVTWKMIYFSFFFFFFFGCCFSPFLSCHMEDDLLFILFSGGGMLFFTFSFLSHGRCFCFLFFWRCFSPFLTQTASTQKSLLPNASKLLQWRTVSVWICSPYIAN